MMAPCGADCSESYPHKAVVHLIATLDPGSAFANWSRDAALSVY